jgi:Zn-dependent protease with chaperone function
MTITVRIGIAGGLAGLVVIGLLLAYFHLFHFIIPAIAFVLLITGLEWVFARLWLLNSRYTEYRQDAFAQRLGFGRELRTSLLKIIGNTPQKVSFFYTLTNSHPIVHNRIRRLEKLEGLRPSTKP